MSTSAENWLGDSFRFTDNSAIIAAVPEFLRAVKLELMTATARRAKFTKQRRDLLSARELGLWPDQNFATGQSRTLSQAYTLRIGTEIPTSVPSP